jgi:protein required for attachment to host cells
MNKRTWILIADGARARILLNEGPGAGLKPATDTEYESDRRPTREVGSDRPGRVHESADVMGHAYAPRVDWHQFAKHLFAREMAQILDAAAGRGAFDDLVLVAPPKTLGELRASLSKGSRAKVSAELGKDLCNVPVHDLPSRLAEVLKL